MSRSRFYLCTTAYACCGETCFLGRANRGSLVLQLVPQLRAAHEDLGTAHLMFHWCSKFSRFCHSTSGCFSMAVWHVCATFVVGVYLMEHVSTIFHHFQSICTFSHGFQGQYLALGSQFLVQINTLENWNSMVPSCYRPTLPEGHKRLGTVYVHRLQHSTDCCALLN